IVVTSIPLIYAYDDFDKPKDVYLAQNYPNPFNSSTTIQYSLTNPINAKLNIINLQGQTILTILNNFQSVGLNQYIWDGKDQIGQPVPAGVYIYQIYLDDGTTQSKKMIFLK
ncbi:MAG: T9SS type A sorting domain-containing protein, partial [Calditrichia bacterium]|nr:T9SS type A sorting domain-containing protein [Calditrichia bacterium]